MTFRAAFDRYTFDATYPYGSDGSTPAVTGFASGVGTRWSVESGVTRSLRPDRHQLAFGEES